MEEIKNVAYSQATYKALPVPILIFDSEVCDFAIILINKAAELLLNVVEHDNINRNFLDFVSAISDNKHLDWKHFLQQVCESKENKTISTFKCVVKPGISPSHSKFLDILFAPVADSNGVLSHVIAIITDVTEKKVANRQNAALNELLLKQRKFLHETQRVARNGTWEIDLSTNSIHWSDMMREIYEIDPGVELDFESALEFFNEADRKRLIAVVEDAIAKGGMFDIELQITTSRGSQLWIRSTGKADVVNGICTRLYGTAQISQRKRKLKQP